MVLNISGITTDNRLVLSGVFIFRDSYGLPLGVIYDVLKANDLVINIEDYINSALKVNWKPSKVKTDLEEITSPEQRYKIDLLIKRYYDAQNHFL